VFAEVTAGNGVLLDIHGDGEERVAIENEIAALELGGAVCMKGRYPDGADYGRLLASYHALVLPSIDCEGLPLVLLEAMSCGLPFLATDIGGIPDVGGGNPDVVITGPAPAMVREGLIRLLAMLLSGHHSNARLKEFYKARFSQEQAERRWREMFAGPREYFAR
jgi:glycosyltransferase involved in cell wall biosynthesis